MALKKEVIQKIATLLKLKETDLETAIKDEKEVDLAVDEKLQVFTETEVTTLKNNEYTRGKDAGIEMEIKDLRTKLNLDFTGKTVEGLLAAYKTKFIADENKAPDKKVQDLEAKVITLTTTVQDYEKKIAEKDAEVSGIRVNGELYKHIPAPGENGPALVQDDIIHLLKVNGYEFKQENGILKTYKSGQLVTDKLGNPVPAKDVVQGFITEKKLVVPSILPDGRGGGNKNPPAKAGKISELKKQFTDQGKSLLGDEFSKAVQEAAKDKDFDMNG